MVVKILAELICNTRGCGSLTRSSSTLTMSGLLRLVLLLLTCSSERRKIARRRLSGFSLDAKMYKQSIQVYQVDFFSSAPQCTLLLCLYFDIVFLFSIVLSRDFQISSYW